MPMPVVGLGLHGTAESALVRIMYGDKAGLTELLDMVRLDLH